MRTKKELNALAESLVHLMKQTCKEHGVQVTVHSQDLEEKVLPGYSNLQRLKEQIDSGDKDNDSTN